MKIWWCQEHDSVIDEDGKVCHGKSAFYRYDDSICRMVPMRLIPDKPPLTVNHCPQNYWEPGLGPCICRGSKHPALDGETP